MNIPRKALLLTVALLVPSALDAQVSCLKTTTKVGVTTDGCTSVYSVTQIQCEDGTLYTNIKYLGESCGSSFA